jgi:hypothetical protein
MFHPFVEASDFQERCQLLLNHPRECSTSRRILVYGILAGLATEISGINGTTASTARYQALAQFSLQRLEPAIADFRTITPPSQETIEALQVAVSGLPYSATSLR